MRKLAILWCLLAIAALTGQAEAVLVDLGPGSFSPQAPKITFDEFPLNTLNPSITLATVNLGNVTVSFEGHFMGQAATGGFPVTLSDTTPTNPLTLDPAAPDTKTVNDAAPGATSPVLSGTPTFNGPIAVWFSVPVAGVGLKGGYFDGVNSTTIEAYDATGASLGSITNSVLGFEFYGLADSTGANVIKGISFYITGNEPAGFEIDDLTFGAAEDIVPEPASFVVWSLLGLFGMGWYRRRRAA